MIRLLRWVSIRELRQRPLRLALVVFGVTCGVTLYLAMALINRSTLDGFERSIEAINGKASFAVLGAETGFPEDLVDAVRDVPGVRSAIPTLQVRAYARSADGALRGVMVIGIDLLQEAAVRTYRSSGRTVIDDPAALLTRPDSVIVTNALARELGLSLGSPLALTAARGTQTFTVHGLLTPEGPAQAYGGMLVLMDIAAARTIFGQDGKTNRIDVVLVPGASVDRVAMAVTARLGSGFRVEQPATQVQAMSRMVSSYQSLLSFLSFAALVVAVFVIGNTFAVAVAERRRAIGTLRALGATRRAIVGLFLGEASLIGLAGSAIGVPAGWLVASGLVRAVTRSLSAQLVSPIEVSAVTVRPADVAVAVLLGVLTSCVAALLPALRATRIAPLEALRPRDVSGSDGRVASMKCSSVAGILMLAAVAACGWLDLSARHAAIRYLEACFALAGVVLVSPGLVTILVRLVRRAVAGLGGGARSTVLRLACDNLLRNASRTASTVRSVVIGLLLVLVASALHASFKSSVGDWFGRILRWDVFISSAGTLSSVEVQPVHESLGEILSGLDGVDPGPGGRALALRIAQLNYRGRSIGLKAFDRPQRADEWRAFDHNGVAVVAAARALFDSPVPAALVSDTFSGNFAIRVGDVVTLDTPSGATPFKVLGVVTDYASPEGVLYVDRAVYRRLWNDPLVTGFGVYLQPGVSVDAFRAAVDRRFGKEKGFVVASHADLRKQSERVLDEAFSFSRALVLAALLVGLVGLFNTLLIGILERLRELGVLRAIGASRRQLMGMVLTESLLLGVLGAMVAALLGLFITRVWLIRSVSALIGWSLSYALPWYQILPVLAYGVLVGLGAGLIPAWRAGRLQIREALTYE
jgi:putative ABC transport system permease protein